VKAKEIREMGIEELEKKVLSLRGEYSKECVKVKIGAKEKTLNLKNLRKDIARTLTVLNTKRKEDLSKSPK
jgi:ribosomal protein L29